MEVSASHSNQPRLRFRSFRYSVSGKTSQKKHEQHPLSRQGQRRESIINISKLNSALLPKHPSTSNQTLCISKKEDNLCMRTFTTFFSRDNIAEEKENLRFKVLIPQYDHQFDEANSDFTLFDCIPKPIKLIENQLAYSQKELIRQRNDLQMLRAEMRTLKNILIQQLSDVQESVKYKVDEMKESLRLEEVMENERRLRSRKEVAILEKGQLLHWRIMEDLKERNLELQEGIFSCRPLQLQIQETPVLEINQNEYL